jgi:predicted RNA-binding Zn-ribbon protein involved in translation (DUF1610 family)
MGMLRRILTIASAASLLLCIAAGVLWARSYRPVAGQPDGFDLTRTQPLYWLVSNPGLLTFCRQEGKDWESPEPKFRFLGIEYASSVVGGSSLRNLFVPYWMLVSLLLVLPAFRLAAWRRHRAIRRRLAAGLCRSCGYNLTANVSGVCPECGTSVIRDYRVPLQASSHISTSDPGRAS